MAARDAPWKKPERKFAGDRLIDVAERQCVVSVRTAKTAITTRLVPVARRIPKLEYVEVERDEEEAADVGQQPGEQPHAGR